MSAPEPEQSVTQQLHVNRVNPDTGKGESGWEVTVRDPVTGVLVPTFIPDAVYGGPQAQTLIQANLEKVRAVHALKF